MPTWWYREFQSSWCFIYFLQVETIGDAYMVVSGVPELNKQHGVSMAAFALDMLQAAAQVPSPKDAKPIMVSQSPYTWSILNRGS